MDGEDSSAEDVDRALAASIRLVDHFDYIRTPWQWTQDVVLRQKPRRIDQIDAFFAEQMPRLAILLAQASRGGELSRGLTGDINVALAIKEIHDIVDRYKPLIEAAKLVPLGDTYDSILEVPYRRELWQLLTFRMVALARRVLQEHGMRHLVDG